MYTILIILFLIFAACEFATITVYGFYINKKALDYFNEYKNTYWLNPIDKNILSSCQADFITNVPVGFICKYYISDIGPVVRWSKAHKEIEQLFKELKEKQ